jgi:hypothetical protein
MKLFFATLAALFALASTQDVDVDSATALDDNVGPDDLDDILSDGVDIEADTPAQDAAAGVEDVEVETGTGCASCPYMATCTTGRDQINAFLSTID